MSIVARDIERILIEEDIEGLISSGAPDDEYASEAKEIFNVIDQSQNRTSDIYATIERIWQRSFSLSKQDIINRSDQLKNVTLRIIAIA